MKKSNARIIWIVWLLSSIIAGISLANTLFQGKDKTSFMPGPLSDGHHQLTEKCDACHGSDAFGGDKETAEVLQAACIRCHGDDRKKPQDSHPLAKFKDPRNADRLEKINALNCVTCHTEHRREITLKDGLTQPLDVCFHCHAKVAEDRPTHEGMPFDTCKDSGCHNYHNNRALYTKFLLKNLDKPDHLKQAMVPEREFAQLLDEVMDYPRERYPIKSLDLEDADAPGEIKVSGNSMRDWLETAHARSGVNCTACHMLKKDDNAEVQAIWVNKPTQAACAQCHKLEVKSFGKGKHGMRVAAGLSPLTPVMAKLPMTQEALNPASGHKQLDCNSCHKGHRYDIKNAAVEACLGCHADDHSLAYKRSKHYELWQAELNGSAEANTGVSCATCHMSRISFDVSEWSSRIMVDHNQSANLSPNSKMIRSACLHCHGLGYSLDALADSTLIQSNFNGNPSVHVKSMELAKEDRERRRAKRGADDDADMFGF
jgi:formate-dependent nitrite reductase cytochrome c552 subunit